MQYLKSTHEPRIIVPETVRGVEIHRGRGGAGEVKQLFHIEHLFLLLSGSAAVLDVRGEQEVVPAGRLIIIEPESEGCCTALSRHRYLALLLDPELVSSSQVVTEEGGAEPRKRWAADSGMAETFVQVCRRIERSVGEESAIEALRPFVELLSRMGFTGNRCDEMGTPVLRRVREQVRSSFTRRLPLDELSHRTGMCKFALVRAFKREFGVPPHAYQTHLRVNFARTLLRDGVPISSAALQAGFSDQSHLNRHFKRRMGLTPGQYARQVARPRGRWGDPAAGGAAASLLAAPDAGRAH